MPGERKKIEQWKHAIEFNTGRTYFYNTATHETTWEKPLSFQVWKFYRDRQTGKTYFYNRITQETQCDKPSDFEEWKQTVDKASGKPYYYNVLTRETSWVRPSTSKRNKATCQGEPGFASTIATMYSASISDEDDRSKGDSGVLDIIPSLSFDSASLSCDSNKSSMKSNRSQCITPDRPSAIRYIPDHSRLYQMDSNDDDNTPEFIPISKSNFTVSFLEFPTNVNEVTEKVAVVEPDEHDSSEQLRRLRRHKALFSVHSQSKRDLNEALDKYCTQSGAPDLAYVDS